MAEQEGTVVDIDAKDVEYSCDADEITAVPVNYFIELDQEIEQYESRILNPMISPPASKPLLHRIFANLRGRFLDGTSTNTTANTVNNTIITDSCDLEEGGAVVTCRICDNPIDANTLDGHTEWCSKYQNCLLKKDKCSKYLHLLLDSLECCDGGNDRLRILVGKALEMDEETGKAASVQLAKLLYKIAKLSTASRASDDNRTRRESLIKRFRYLVEQKRVLADRFAELKPPADSFLPSSCEFSSCTDSSLESTPNRPLTPVAKLTTMLSALLGKPRSSSRSPQFGSSPTRSGGGLRSSFSIKGPLPKISDFEIIKPISRGAFGSVYLARKRKTNDLYAIKALRKDDLIRKNMTSHVLTERRMLSLAQAPFTVMLYYAFESRDFLFLVMEYLNGGDLSSKLQADGHFSESVAKFYIAELVQTVEYLHEHGIIHRDIKPDNMLLDGEGHLRLTDFGLANLHTRPYEGRLLGTPEYIAPEIIRGEDHGTAVDWWAVGVCLFEFLIGVPPFGGDSAEEIFEAITAFTGINWESFDGFGDISATARDLIDRLLDVDANTRLGSVGTKTHAFFDGVVWEKLRVQPAPWRPLASIDPLDTSNFDARNKRYEAMGVPEGFLEAEPVEAGGGDSTSGFSTPSRLGGPLNRRTSSSPFDGFNFKNIDLLSKVNRKLSSTPSAFFTTRPASRASSSGTLSDGGFSSS